jgi:hypothetical protein
LVCSSSEISSSIDLKLRITDDQKFTLSDQKGKNPEAVDFGDHCTSRELKSPVIPVFL